MQAADEAKFFYMGARRARDFTQNLVAERLTQSRKTQENCIHEQRNAVRRFRVCKTISYQSPCDDRSDRPVQVLRAIRGGK